MSLKNILGSFQPKTTTDTEPINVLTVDDPNYTTEPEVPKVSNEQQDDTTEDIFRKIGYTKEDVDSWNTPSQEPVLSRLYKKTVTEPTPISEKGIKASRAYGSLGDSIGLLADAFGASRGAHVAARDVNGAANQANMELAARERNKAQVKEYQSGLLNAEASDAQSGYARKAQLRSQMQQALYNYRKQQQALYNHRELRQDNAKDLQQKAEQFKAKLKQDASQHKDKIGIDQYNAKTGRMKLGDDNGKNKKGFMLGDKIYKIDKNNYDNAISNAYDALMRDNEFVQKHASDIDVIKSTAKNSIDGGRTAYDVFVSKYAKESPEAMKIIYQAAGEDYPKPQPSTNQPYTNKYLEVGTKKTDSNTAPWKK